VILNSSERKVLIVSKSQRKSTHTSCPLKVWAKITVKLS